VDLRAGPRNVIRFEITTCFKSDQLKLILLGAVATLIWSAILWWFYWENVFPGGFTKDVQIDWLQAIFRKGTFLAGVVVIWGSILFRMMKKRV
jgi:hypothetical protein